MRAAKMSPAPRSGHPHPEAKPGAASERPTGKRKRDGPRSGLNPWLRWVPVPLAALVAVIGLLVMGSLQGQVAAANASRPTAYQAGGLALNIDTMLWMMNMKASPSGYQMPVSMMPGMQAPGTNRLHVEVTLSDATSDVQRYSITDFSVAGRGGKTWKVRIAEHSDVPASGSLEPGFQATLDLYFDVPASQSKHLTLKWSRGGTMVSIPVSTGVGPKSMKM